MGKDKRKGIDRSNYADYYLGTGKIGKLMDRYGVEGTRLVKPDNRGYSNGGDVNDGTPRTRDDVDREIAEKMMADYDTRRGMEAAALAGDKEAAKFAKKGYKQGNIYSAYEKLEDLKKEHVGGGGMNGPKNIAGLTHALVTHDRDTQTAAYDEKYAKTTDLNDLKDKLMAQASEKAAGVNQKEIEPSDRLASVQDRFEKAASNTPPSMFDKQNTDPAKADDQADAARTFLTDYKKDVVTGARLKEDIETNIANASKAVTNVYGR